MKRKLIFLTLALVITVPVLFFISCSEAKVLVENSTETTLSQASDTTIVETNTSQTSTSKTKTSETITLATIGPEESYQPVINPEDFYTRIDNKYFPLVPGTTFVYEGVSEDGKERNEVIVTADNKEILGVTCVVVLDLVWGDDKLVEQTLDWYAQDKDGSLWYFGEDTKEFENGQVVSTKGSWESGVNGAKPGILMEANPRVGDSYRQEYLKGEAEDMVDVLSISENVSVKYGTFSNCLKTRDYSPLEPDVFENKYYAAGVGPILTVQEGSVNVRMELIEIKEENPKSVETILKSIEKITKITKPPDTTAPLDTTAPPPALPSGHIDIGSKVCGSCHSV